MKKLLSFFFTFALFANYLYGADGTMDWDNPDPEQYTPKTLVGTMTTTIEIPQTLHDVIPISDKTRENLFWYFSISKEWEIGKGMEAMYLEWDFNPRNKKTYGILTVHFTQFHNRYGEPSTPVSVLTKFLQIQISQYSWREKGIDYNEFISGLSLDLHNNLWVTFRDNALHASRDDTLEKLNLVANLINEASKGKEELVSKLYAEGSILKMDGEYKPFSVMDVEISYEFLNHYKIKGYVNPDVKGSVSANMYDKETNVCLRDNNSNYFTGWSENANEFYYFEIMASSAYGDEATQDVRFDLTFTPAEVEVMIDPNQFKNITLFHSYTNNASRMAWEQKKAKEKATIVLFSTNYTVVTIPRWSYTITNDDSLDDELKQKEASDTEASDTLDVITNNPPPPYRPANRTWLWLLALPVVAGVWLVVRLRKKHEK